MREIAINQLAGVGNPVREWPEFTGRAYHLRRRVTLKEQAVTGDALDLRGTSEAMRRWHLAKLELPSAALDIAVEEIGIAAV